jgi:hypothetical protein
MTLMKKLSLLFTLLVTWTAQAAVPLPIAALAEQADALLGQEVAIQALLVGVCKHGGKKGFLRDPKVADSSTLQVRCKEAKPFDRSMVGDEVIVLGLLRETRIDHEYLAKWEAHAKEEQHKEHQHDETGGCADCQGKAPAASGDPSVFERIAEMRSKVEQSDRGYLPVYWIEASSWKAI